MVVTVMMAGHGGDCDDVRSLGTCSVLTTVPMMVVTMMIQTRGDITFFPLFFSNATMSTFCFG